MSNVIVIKLKRIEQKKKLKRKEIMSLAKKKKEKNLWTPKVLGLPVYISGLGGTIRSQNLSPFWSL